MVIKISQSGKQHPFLLNTFRFAKNRQRHSFVFVSLPWATTKPAEIRNNLILRRKMMGRPYKAFSVSEAIAKNIIYEYIHIFSSGFSRNFVFIVHFDVVCYSVRWF